MAANKTSRPKRKDRKNVEYGVAHIRSTFNNTIVTITDKMVMLYPGLVLVDSVSEVLEKHSICSSNGSRSCSKSSNGTWFKTG